MAQGPVKKKAAATGRKSKPQPARTSHATRIIKPRKANLISKQKLLKKHTAGLTAMTEKHLAAKAGHLELMGDKKKTGKGSHGKKT